MERDERAGGTAQNQHSADYTATGIELEDKGGLFQGQGSMAANGSMFTQVGYL